MAVIDLAAVSTSGSTDHPHVAVERQGEFAEAGPIGY